MKILKILIILLVPALGFVGCKKCDVKPANPASASASTVTDAQKSSDINAPETSSRFGDGEVVIEEEGNMTGVIASGDDDRDGGDKKHKKITR